MFEVHFEIIIVFVNDVVGNRESIADDETQNQYSNGACCISNAPVRDSGNETHCGDAQQQTKGPRSFGVPNNLAAPIPWNVVGNPCTEGNIEGNLGSSKNNNSQGEYGKVWCTCSDECSQRNAKEPESQCATTGHCINAVTNEWRCQTGELGNR